MPRFQALHIRELAAGSRVNINGRTYMRLADTEDDRFITDWVADLETGWMGPWYRLCGHLDMVIGLPHEECSACRQVGALHCSDPSNCGGMKPI